MAQKRQKLEAINPLTPEHYDMIQRELDDEHRIREAIERAESCGVRCDAQLRQLEEVMDALRKIKSVHFPQGRPK